MTTAITVLAFDDDARIFNRTLGDRYSLAPDFGITTPLAATSKPSAIPGSGLHWFEAKLSTAGLAALRAGARRDRKARRLRLNEGEYFGLRLSAWRDIEGIRYEADLVYDMIERVDAIASYKIAATSHAGERGEVMRLKRARTEILKSMREKLAKDLALEKSLHAMLRRNRALYRF